MSEERLTTEEARARGDAQRPPPEAPPEAFDPSETTEREALLDEFDGLFAGTGGIDSWLRDGTPQTVVSRLMQLDRAPLTREQLTQLLVLSHEAGPSPDFFHYYWLSIPDHPYDVRRLPDFDPAFAQETSIRSLAHLRWGLRRFYIDALLFFGNVRSAYRKLRELSAADLRAFFNSYRYDTEALTRRGPPLDLRRIARDDRYLISEMACKSLASGPDGSDLARVLREAYNRQVAARGATTFSVRQLLDDAPETEQTQLTFAASELLADELTSLEELEAKVSGLIEKFEAARGSALQNTKLYLSMVEELDVYVATSMRSRDDFRDMAAFCESVFTDDRLSNFDVRHFDPTMSAAEGHEDKGLIECLMVKSAKALIYYAGSKESFGKDAEAAMALSQGKPVILYSPDEERRRFYRDVHPLGRLIDFRTGVAHGWMVARTPEEVAELLNRILGNRMVYQLDQAKPGYLRLKEEVTGSVVRLQTNDVLLRETFWNYYHRDRQSPLGEAR